MPVMCLCYGWKRLMRIQAYAYKDKLIHISTHKRASLTNPSGREYYKPGKTKQKIVGLWKYLILNPRLLGNLKFSVNYF